MTPIISQWPVVVSFPGESSAIAPQLARGAAEGGQPSISVMFPKPQLCRFGNASPPTRFAVLPRVLAPASPYSGASGSAPAPQESMTMTTKRPGGIESPALVWATGYRLPATG